jgi:hypothetical protein
MSWVDTDPRLLPRLSTRTVAEHFLTAHATTERRWGWDCPDEEDGALTGNMPPGSRRWPTPPPFTRPTPHFDEIMARHVLATERQNRLIERALLVITLLVVALFAAGLRRVAVWLMGRAG